MSPLFQSTVRARCFWQPSPRFLGMVLGLFPDKRRFQQFSSIWKSRRSLKTMWFLRVSQKLAAGRDPNWSPGRKNRVSACVLHCVWRGPAGQQAHVPHFLQEQPGNDETAHTSLAAQCKQDQSRMQRAVLSLWDRGTIPGRVHVKAGPAFMLLWGCWGTWDRAGRG